MACIRLYVVDLWFMGLVATVSMDSIGLLVVLPKFYPDDRPAHLALGEWRDLAADSKYASVKADLAKWLPKTSAPSAGLRG